MTMDELIGILQILEHQINRSKTSFQEKPFKFQANARGRGRGRNGSIEALEEEVVKTLDKEMMEEKAQDE